MNNTPPKLDIGEFTPITEETQIKQEDDLSLSTSTLTKITDKPPNSTRKLTIMTALQKVIWKKFKNISHASIGWTKLSWDSIISIFQPSFSPKFPIRKVSNIQKSWFSQNKKKAIVYFYCEAYTKCMIGIKLSFTSQAYDFIEVFLFPNLA